MHTPTPYRASTFISGSKIPTSSSVWAGENETLRKICTVHPQGTKDKTRATKEFIEAACNAFKSLTDSLKELLEAEEVYKNAAYYYDNGRGDEDAEPGSDAEIEAEFSSALDRLLLAKKAGREALAKAGVK